MLEKWREEVERKAAKKSPSAADSCSACTNNSGSEKAPSEEVGANQPATAPAASGDGSGSSGSEPELAAGSASEGGSSSSSDSEASSPSPPSGPAPADNEEPPPAPPVAASQKAAQPVPDFAFSAALTWEREDVLFKQECELLKLVDAANAGEAAKAGGDAKLTQWVDQGKGLLRLLRHQDTGRARAVMQQSGALHVLLNARVLLDKFQAEGKRVVRFLASERASASANGWERPTYFRVKLPNTPQQERLAAVLAELRDAAVAAKPAESTT